MHLAKLIFLLSLLFFQGADPEKAPASANGLSASISNEQAKTGAEPSRKLVIKNTGSTPVKICKLMGVSGGFSSSKIDYSVSFSWKSDTPPLEMLRKELTELKPGESFEYDLGAGLPANGRQVEVTFAVPSDIAKDLGIWAGTLRAEIPAKAQ